MLTHKIRKPLCARFERRQIRFAEGKQSRVQTVSREQIAGWTVIQRNAGFVVTRKWDHVDYAFAQIDVSDFHRPIADPRRLLYRLRRSRNELNVWQGLKLFVRRNMVSVS